MMQDPLEEFLLPLDSVTVANDVMISGVPKESPSKLLGLLQSERKRTPKVPESPDMKIARDRLGTLLNNIRRGDGLPDSNEFTYSPIDAHPVSIPPQPQPERPTRGRPRKTVNTAVDDDPSHTVFEFRGKPFALDGSARLTPYQLCRAWIRGKNIDSNKPRGVKKYAPAASIDYLLSRPVEYLPRPVTPDGYTEPPLIPDDKDLDQMSAASSGPTVNISQDALIREYQRHWKALKKNYIDHSMKMEVRYSQSAQLLDTMFYRAHGF